jgi:hypothetical protein
MAEFRPTEKDPLKWPAPKRPPFTTSRRIGIHTSIAGGVENAAERAFRLGSNTFQIFSSSPRQWQPYSLGRPSLGYAAIAILIPLSIAYAIAGRRTVRDRNRTGLWFLLLSIGVLIPLMHGLQMLGVQPR